MLRSLEVAAELGSEKAILHPSMVTGMGGFLLDTARRYMNEFLLVITHEAQQLGITLCLENMFPRCLLGVEPDDIGTILEAFPALKFTLDTGHASIQDPGGNRLFTLVKQCGHRLGHLHFSDNLGRRDDHLPIGEGTINFNKLIRLIKDTGYDDTLTLEVFSQDRRVLSESRDRVAEMLA
jgi:sugar phosphate isomerase/epimerase